MNGRSSTRVHRLPYFFFLPFPPSFGGKGARATLYSVMAWPSTASPPPPPPCWRRQRRCPCPRTGPTDPQKDPPGQLQGPLFPKPRRSPLWSPADRGPSRGFIPLGRSRPPLPYLSPPGSGGEAGSSRGARSSRATPGGTGSHFEGSPGL